ncbi:MAG: PAS domain S-box protein [Calditrichaeota bacterium]|nr:PAS domain S-box protein [Calditrichota bacterium]
MNYIDTILIRRRNSSSDLNTYFLRISIIISFFCLIVSIIVMFGWLSGISFVLNLLPGAATMKFNTALLFFFSAFAVFARMIKQKEEFFLSLFSAAFVFVFALITLCQDLFGFNFSIDTLLVNDPYSLIYPGRMSEATAVCFLLLSYSVISQSLRIKFSRNLNQYLLLTVSLISLVSIIAYILDVPPEDRIYFFSTMAIHTAGLFLLLSIAISLKQYNRGFTGLLTGSYSGSKLLRVFLPYIIVLPVFLSYVLVLMNSKQLVDINFAVAIYTVLFILITVLFISVISIWLNTTDQKRNELERILRRTNNELSYFKHALDRTSIVAATDNRGVINYVNDKFCEISKYSMSELLGKTHRIINSGQHSSEFFKDMWATIKAGDIWVGDIKNKAKDGSFYWMHTSIVPFKDESGKVYRFLSIRQDITRLKETEHLLTGYVSKLEEKNKELEQFAYIASHDLQEPLRTVSSFIELLEDKNTDQFDAESKKYVEFINKSTQRMSDLIRALLDYSSIGRSRKMVLIRANDLLTDIIADLQNQIDEAKATIKVAKLPVLKGYKTEIRMLFQNLLQNAIKFRDKNRKPLIEIGAESQRYFWRFSVTDNGIGIDEKYQFKIFEIFQRLHHASDYEGAGIGLAHCRKIVNLHDGKIWIESKKDKGTTFFFTVKKF